MKYTKTSPSKWTFDMMIKLLLKENEIGEISSKKLEISYGKKLQTKVLQGLYLVLGDINQKDKYNFQSGKFSKAYL